MVAQECTPTPRPQRSRTCSAPRPHSVRSVSAQFPQHFRNVRSLSAVITQYCRCSALCPHCSPRLSAVFPHHSRSLGRIVSEGFVLGAVKVILALFCACVDWYGTCDKMASELPESAYSDWSIGTRVTERVGDSANVITFEGTF